MAAEASGAGSGDAGPLFIAVSVAPGSRETGVAGRRPDGTFRIAVKAPPSENRANAELIGFLAREFGVPRSRVKIATGSSSRRKLVRIDRPAFLPDWLGQGRPSGTGCR